MPDFDVIVNANPTLITVVDNPTVITVATPGVQGAPGINGIGGFQVTGSSSVLYPDLTGVGGTLVILSGNYVLISGVNTGVLTGSFAQLYNNNLFTQNNTFSGNVNITGGNQINFPSSIIQDSNLFGTWNSQGLQVSGNNVLTGFNSGIYITTGQTGVLTGQFYSINNPSSFINYASLHGYTLSDSTLIESINLNNRLLYSSVGDGTTTVDYQNRLLTGGTWDTQSLTVQGSSVITNKQTGVFVTTGNTGVFATTIFVASNYIADSYFSPYQTTINNINNLTGSFVLTGNTGIFVTNTQTGLLTGQFYPLNNNPSSYITSSQYRAGNVPVGSNATMQAVSFSSNFTGTNYAVSLTPDNTMASANSLAATGKTISGFTISATLGVVGGYSVDWTAWLYN